MPLKNASGRLFEQFRHRGAGEVTGATIRTM